MLERDRAGKSRHSADSGSPEPYIAFVVAAGSRDVGAAGLLGDGSKFLDRPEVVGV